jgi:hypothetical protein|tara:strand:- start:248 stop:499 length:252 start_codon:yes stop_codon:yes gene_type:complete
MNEHYKKLMAQHGGYIPFTVLGGKYHKKPSKKRTKRPTKNNKKTVRNKGPSFVRDAGKYTAGTIIRNNGTLYQLNSNKSWNKI